MKRVMTEKRGQAAIEFMITYGWAILAVMTVIAALAYFGMTNPASNLPDKCTFSNGFDCRDYQINATGLRLKVINIAGQTIYGSGASTIINASLTENSAPCAITGGNPTMLDPEVEIEIICNNVPNSPFNTKEKAKVKVTINFAKNNGGYNQVALGEIYATVQ